MGMRSGGGRAVVAILVLVSLGDIALAEDDAGVHTFFSSGSGQLSPAPEIPRGEVPRMEAQIRRRVASDHAPTHRLHVVGYRPLTVYRQKPKMVAAASQTPQEPSKVSIYDDPTLRAGDAVMTADGIRVFAGSRSWPYAKSDFVKIGEAHDLSRETLKVLAGLNSAPRS